MMQLLASALDATLLRQFAQHALELGAVSILHPEGARDLARADFSGVLAHIGDEVVFGGEGWFFGKGACHEVRITNIRFNNIR